MGFMIRMTKEVCFNDRHGKVKMRLMPGDTFEASFDSGHYWVTGIGGIYKDEAVRLEDEIDDRFIHLSNN